MRSREFQVVQGKGCMYWRWEVPTIDPSNAYVHWLIVICFPVFLISLIFYTMFNSEWFFYLWITESWLDGTWKNPMSSLAYLTEEKSKRLWTLPGHGGWSGTPTFPSSSTHSAFNLLSLFPTQSGCDVFFNYIDNWLIYWVLCMMKQELLDHHIFPLH